MPWLVSRGVRDNIARSLLGGAVKQLGAEAAWELASECIRQGVLDPAPWLSKALNERISARSSTGRRKGSRADERAAWNAELSEVLAEPRGVQRTEKNMGVIDVSGS